MFASLWARARRASSTSQGYSRIILARLHGFGAGVGKVGVVAAVCCIGAEVLDGYAGCLQMLFDDFLEFVTGVVATHCHRFAGAENQKRC